MRSSTQIHPDRIKKIMLQVRADLQDIAASLEKPGKSSKYSNRYLL